MVEDLAPYLQSPSIERLEDWVGDTGYVRLPDDWAVFVADVEQSTQAIEAGRYKEVNALGAACIVAVSNACGEDRIPYSFGGDGASFVLPPSLHAAARGALLGLRARAERAFGLRLRVGCVPLQTLSARGLSIRVARRRMPAGFDLALFTGGGVAQAESWVKADPQRYAFSPAPVPAPLSVQGLECRWNDVPSSKGRVLTLLVQARDGRLERLRQLLQQVGALMPQSNPVRRENLPLSWPPRHLGTELRLRHGTAALRGLHHAGVWLLTGLFARVVQAQADDPQTQAGRYVASLLANTDHLKMDDMFRAVLDVSDEEARAIENTLEALHQAGHLDYGLHYSKHALMTCFVRSMSRHLHFVDGGEGGYAMAALRLKASRSDQGR